MNRITSFKDASTLRRPMAVAFALLVSVCLAAASIPVASARPNHDIRWAEGGTPVALTTVGYQTVVGGTVVGCAGSAWLSLPTGADTLIFGASLGADSCTTGNPACIPYQALSPRITCQNANNLAYWIHSPGSVSTSIEVSKLGCLRAFWVVWDVDGNPNTPGTPGSEGYEEWLGPFVGFVPANPDGSLPC